MSRGRVPPRLPAFMVLALVAGGPATATDWPHLRGPEIDGRSRAPGTFEGEGVGCIRTLRLVDGTNTLELLTCGNGGQSGNESAGVRGISDNGRRCVFGSSASNLVANDGNGKTDAFVEAPT